MHTVRRALIAAIQVVKEQNRGIADARLRDRVCIITFDRLHGGGPTVEQPLTADYDASMRACATLQATSDQGPSSAIEAGLLAARIHLASPRNGGRGRDDAEKIVIVLSSGRPDLYVSDPSELARFVAGHKGAGCYNGGRHAHNAPLMQAARMQAEQWPVFALGVGLDADLQFINRLARFGGTSHPQSRSLPPAVQPLDCERRLTDLVRQILAQPDVHMAQ
jgi:hypothetical protein